MGLAIAIMETIIIDEIEGSYMLYVAKTKSGKRVIVAAYYTAQIKRKQYTERIFSSRSHKLWKELRSMI